MGCHAYIRFVFHIPPLLFAPTALDFLDPDRVTPAGLEELDVVAETRQCGTRLFPVFNRCIQLLYKLGEEIAGVPELHYGNPTLLRFCRPC